MKAILRRELSAYFNSAIGYVYLVVFLIFSGFLFYSGTLASQTADLRPVFGGLFVIILLITPIITMRLLSEDKKQKTDQILLTSPVSIFSVVFSKFLAAVIIFSIGVGVTLVYSVVLSAFAPVEWSVVICNVIGLILLGSALISIGLFLSALTESQVVAAISAYGAMLFVMVFDNILALIPFAWVAKVASSLSFSQNYGQFTLGLINFSSVLYFVSIIAIFIFLTIRIIEKRRWS